jgi:mono/diheme cytochrome c family protein
MTGRTRVALLCSLALALAAVPVTHVWASPGAPGPPAAHGPGDPVKGKGVYREFCGNCHALKEALAAGFGGNNKLGEDGGPSFNWLRVSANLSVVAITEAFGGHELVVRRMTWKQIYDCAAFVEKATKNHPYLARVSDG